MLSRLRFTARHLRLQSLGRLPKLGDALPKRRKKSTYIISLLEIIVKQWEHLILINQQSEEWSMLAHFRIKWSSRAIPGASTPLTYPIELDHELLKLIFILRGLHIPVSVMSLKEKAKLVIQPHNPVRSENFSTDTNLLYVPNYVPSNWKVFLANSVKMLHVYWKPESILNETPVFSLTAMVASKCILKKGESLCGSFLREWKKHLTVILSATADGQMLPPMVFFKEKTKQATRDLNISLVFIVKHKRRLWWMMTWSSLDWRA